MSEINVVPYIDVMLVLLVIFMATAPLLTQGVQVDLPQAPSKAIDTEEPDPLVVSMRKDGALFLNIGLASRTKKEEDGTRVTIFSLSEQAGKVLRARTDVPVYIKADATLPGTRGLPAPPTPPAASCCDRRDPPVTARTPPSFRNTDLPDPRAGRPKKSRGSSSRRRRRRRKREELQEWRRETSAAGRERTRPRGVRFQDAELPKFKADRVSSGVRRVHAPFVMHRIQAAPSPSLRLPM